MTCERLQAGWIGTMPRHTRFGAGSRIGAALVVLAVLYVDVLGRDALMSAIESLAPAIVALGTLVVSYVVFIERRTIRHAGAHAAIRAHLGTRPDHSVLAAFNRAGAGAAPKVWLTPQVEILANRKDRIVTDVANPTLSIWITGQSETVDDAFGPGHALLGKDPIPPYAGDIEYRDVPGSDHADATSMTRTAERPKAISEVAAARFPSWPPQHVLKQDYDAFQARRRAPPKEHRTRFQSNKDI